MPSESGAAWSPPAGNGERRLSNSSDGSAGSGYSKALSSDSADFLATRPHTAAVLPGKPAGNPLQFVRTGPADLCKSARDQLRRAELAQRDSRVRREIQEDWQSNLDTWKSSRRKRVEHLIERCVEVRRMEQEPASQRGKSKTFNEMLEERSGRRRRNPLALYTEEEANDLSDLGIGTSSTKSSLSEDCDNHSLASDGMDLDKNHSDVDNLSNCGSTNRKLGSSSNEYDTCTTTTISSPEPEEYTYEGAIEGYKSRIISKTNSNILNTVVNNNFNQDKSNKTTNGDVNRIRTAVTNKFEAKVSSFQQDKINDTRNNNLKKDLPKIDINKRREQFERENSQDVATNKPKITDINSKKSIKDRLSSLEKFTEDLQVPSSKLPVEVVTLKERLFSLEKVKAASCEVEKTINRLNGDLSQTQSVKQRLNSLKSQSSEEDVKLTKTELTDVSMSLKERLSSLHAARSKEIPKISIEEELSSDNNFELSDQNKDQREVGKTEENLKNSLSGIESQMQSFCRSLDSLDINGQSPPNSFERVPSLEDFDCADLQSNIIPSDIETEDSGIHTARDSCAPVDDIADLTQVASPIGEPMVEVSEYESSNEDMTPALVPKGEEFVEKYITNSTGIAVEEHDDQDISKTEDTDSNSIYVQALSQPNEDLSGTGDITEIQTDKEDEDTVKSLDNHDDSVIDALEIAFKEIDSEDFPKNDMENFSKHAEKIVPSVKEKQHSNEDVVETKQDKEVKSLIVTPLYENIDIFYQNAGAEPFPLDLPANVLEPPKEKPPPPPTDDCLEDELLGNGNFRHSNSARRIKKEIRNKRTSFLGIDGQVDDSYLDAELTLAPRPDITSFLQEETKIERLLYKKTLSHDMDSKLRESRDSGVDLDRGPSAEAWYNRQNSSPEGSNPHSRQNSEPYTQGTMTSDEEEAMKKQQTFSDQLSTKLDDVNSERSFRENIPDQSKIDRLDKKLQEQQVCANTNAELPGVLYDDAHAKEVLRFERELLQLEQEELRRQRENLLRESQTRRLQKSVQDVTTIGENIEKTQNKKKTDNQNYRHSMPNLVNPENYISQPIPIERTGYTSIESLKRKPFVSEEHMQRHFGFEESMRLLSPNGSDDGAKNSNECAKRQVPKNEQVQLRHQQPVLPPKPRSRESVEREITMRSSRVPSAVEYVNVERTNVQLRPQPVTNGQYHPMSRHTLQVLSAAPTPKLITGSEWLQSRSGRAQATTQNYNYNQHWLIQEAEQRRMEEQRNKLRNQRPPNQRHSYHQETTKNPVNRIQLSSSHQQLSQPEPPNRQSLDSATTNREGERILSVSGRKKCSHCGEELGRGAAMIIESLSLCYHVWCFNCAVCGARLGDGRAGADVRVRARKLHCHHCYSSDDGRKFSCV